MTDTTINQFDHNLSLLATTTNGEERTIIKQTKNELHVMQNNNNNHNNINTCSLSLLNSPMNKSSLLLFSNPSLTFSHQHPTSASHYLSLLSSPSEDRIGKNDMMLCETITDDQNETSVSVHHQQHHHHSEEQNKKSHQLKQHDNNSQDCDNMNDNDNTILYISDALYDDDVTDANDDDMVHHTMKWKWELQNELDQIQLLRIQNAYLLNRLAMLGVYNEP